MRAVIDRVFLRAALAAAIGVACAVPAFSQPADQDQSAAARLHLGPLAIAPSITLTNLGIDTNVFNQEGDPKRDFTAAIAPRADVWLRLGHARLSGRASVEFAYFRKYSRERSVNTDNEVRLDLPLNRIRPFATVSFLNSRQRLGYEIDARARRVERGATLGSHIRILAKTSLELTGTRSRVDFDDHAVFLGTSLRDVLNRDVERVSVTLRHRLTPVTTVVLLADAERDRFDLSPARNSDSVRVTPGLELGSRALIGGRAFVGYRKFDTLGPGVPNHRGAVASVDLGYTLMGITRFNFRAERDINYSFEASEPYYLVTVLSGSITHIITSAWDVQVTGGRQRLSYRRVGMPESAHGRVDRLGTYGGGVGYRINRDMRLGVSVDYYRRRSTVARRGYGGLRAGASITYGS